MTAPLYFFLTWDENGRQLTVGHNLNGYLSFYVFTDQQKAEAYEPTVSVPHILGKSFLTGDMRDFAQTLLGTSEFTHVVLDDDPRTQMTLADFISKLS